MENLLREEIGELKSDSLLYISKYFQRRKTMVLERETSTTMVCDQLTCTAKNHMAF